MIIWDKITSFWKRSETINPPRSYDEVYAKGFMGEHPVNYWIRGVYYIGPGKIYDPTTKRICKASHIVRIEDYDRVSDPDKLYGTKFDFGYKTRK